MFDMLARKKRQVEKAKKNITVQYRDGWNDLEPEECRSYCVRVDKWATLWPWPFDAAGEVSVCKFFCETGCSRSDCSGQRAHQEYIRQMAELKRVLENKHFNWTDYLVKTSVARKIQDWKEYKDLKRQIEDAKRLLAAQKSNLVHTFDEDEDSEALNSCIKRRVFMYEQKFDKKGSFTGYEPVYTQPTRCTEFAPIGDEQLCSHANCQAYARNKKYHDALVRVRDLESQYKNFWTDKIAALGDVVLDSVRVKEK